jgi:pimeloyl-ACP methyl ester carboxylesterase
LRSFCEELDLENPILVGNSMGGHIALDYVLQYPQKVSALVLTGSSGIQEKDFGSTFPRRKDRDYIREQAALTFYEDLINETIMDEIMEVVNSPKKLLTMLAIARDTHEYNIEEYLPDIPHKTLLVWGKNDEITPPEVAQRFEDKLPNARLRWIDKCGHAPMMEYPETFALYLNEFLIELHNKFENNTRRL